MLRTVPPNGVLFVDGDNAFALAYLQTVLGERPDVTIYDRNGQLFRDELREPGSAPRVGESPLEYRIRREIEFVGRAVSAESPRPVSFMTWPGYELPRGLRFDPEGLFYRVRRADEAPGDAGALWAGYADEAITAQARRLDDPFALTLAATYPLMRGEHARVRRNAAMMESEFGQASELARASESIHNYLGTVWGRQGNYARAIAEFEQALSIHPVSVRAWNNLALARSLGGDAAGARRAWETSLGLDPNQPDVVRSLGR